MTKLLAFFFLSLSLFANCPLEKDFFQALKTDHFEENQIGSFWMYSFSSSMSFSKELLSLSLTPSDEFQNYVEFVSDQTPTDWKFLIQRQNKIFHTHGRSTETADKILSGELGQVRKVNCLESMLLSKHLKISINPLRSEFFAKLFKRETQLKLMFFSFQKPYGYTPPRFKQIKETLLKQGWSYEFLLHNHPFNFNTPDGDIAGTIVPSSTDLRFFEKEQKKGLKKSLITNGFDTLKI